MREKSVACFKVLSQLLSGAVHKTTKTAGLTALIYGRKYEKSYEAVMPRHLLHKMGFSGRLNPLLHAK